MAANYRDHILSAVPKAQWQQPNTPIKKFVNGCSYSGSMVTVVGPKPVSFFNFIILYSAVLGHDSLSTNPLS